VSADASQTIGLDILSLKIAATFKRLVKSTNSSSARSDRMVGRYRVYTELASGGMATVHLGCLLAPGGFQKLVAIKCLHEEFASKPEFVAMFLNEARLASTIHHPNVVASLDVVVEQDELMVVMEYVHGETLAGLLRLSRQRSEPAPLRVVVRVLADTLEGLHAAHTASLAGNCLNIVHRDVSPQNIMIGADGNTKVLDFGIAKAALSAQLTSAGMVRGKVAYMSPEQVQGALVDARTDVFAAGVVLWEALTGRRLFYAQETREAVGKLLQMPIPAPSEFNPALGPELDGVVRKALQRNVDERYQSAHEFAQALRQAAAEGSRTEVAAWVNGLAAGALAWRQELLHTLEASAIHPLATAALSAAHGSSPRAAPEGTHTHATAVTSILPHPQRAGVSRRAPWAFALVGALSALAAWLLVGGAAEPEPPRVSASGLPVATQAKAGIATEEAVAAPSASQTGESPDSTLPIVAADSIALAPPTTSPDPKRAGKRLSPRAEASARPSAVRGASCDPPYRIDASGVRRVKAECL
jgi:serine/threonine-protein kinase